MRLVLSLVMLAVMLSSPIWTAGAAEAADRIDASELLRIDPVILPVLREQGPVAVVTVVVSIRMRDAQAVFNHANRRIRLQGAFFDALTTLLAFERPDGRYLDEETTRRFLHKRAVALIGEDAIVALNLDMMDVQLL